MNTRLRTTVLGAAVACSGVALLVTPSSASPAVASATLVDINGREVGEALFRHGPDGRLVATVSVAIAPEITGNPGEFHGLHIHAGGAQGCVTFAPGTEPALSARFTEVGGHWRRGEEAHGSHAGDLPSLVRNADGTAESLVQLDKADVHDIVGRALIVHHLADDFGKHPGVGTSTTTGNAGPRYACGVITGTAAR